MELLMFAGRLRIALRTTHVTLAVRCTAVAYGILASDHAFLACASPAGIFGWRESIAVVDFAPFVPAACKITRMSNHVRINNILFSFHVILIILDV